MGLNDYASNENENPYYEYENLVVSELYNHLSEDGFNVETYNTGVDVIAESDNRTLAIEMKCHYEDDPGQKVYTALGQIIYRMDKEDINSDSVTAAVGFPRDIEGTEVYREHIEENVSRDILEALTELSETAP